MRDGVERRNLGERRASQTKERGTYRLAEYRIDAIHHRLYRDNELLTDDERTVEFLWLLIRDYPRTLDKEALLSALWPRVVTSRGGDVLRAPGADHGPIAQLARAHG